MLDWFNQKKCVPPQQMVTTIHIGSSPHSLSPLIDAEGHNVQTECIFVKESIRCSKELAAIFKDSFEDAPYNGPFVWEKLLYRWRFIWKSIQVEHLWFFRMVRGISTGEVYTIISYKDAHGKKGCITESPCCLETWGDDSHSEWKRGA